MKKKSKNKKQDTKDSIKSLIEAISNLHGCDSIWIESVAVKEMFQGQTVWDGIIEVFELINHPTVKKCYAWSYLVDDSEKRKFVAVLHQTPVDSPEKAVRAAIIREYQNPQERR